MRGRRCFGDWYHSVNTLVFSKQLEVQIEYLFLTYPDHLIFLERDLNLKDVRVTQRSGLHKRDDPGARAFLNLVYSYGFRLLNDRG